MRKSQILIATLLSSAILTSTVASSSVSSFANSSSVNSSSLQQMIQHNQLNPVAVKLALNAYQWALQHGYVKNTNYITLVDFTLPSNKKRMYILDLKTDKVIVNTYVAHGRTSGMTTTTHFSDAPGSNASMYGAFVTTQPYFGKHGLSLRVEGLEKGINDKAMSRAVVIHSAWYATPAFIKTYGRMGRSDGCFTVGPDQIHGVISKIKDRSFFYAYAPAENHDPIACNSHTA